MSLDSIASNTSTDACRTRHCFVTFDLAFLTLLAAKLRWWNAHLESQSRDEDDVFA